MPLAIDLFCGLGGWTEGLLMEGWDVIGIDIEEHVYDEHRYPARLVLHDVRGLHGAWFKDADLIVASPPCQEYSYMAMPWSKAKAKAAEYRAGTRDVKQLTALFDACFRIQREACKAAGRHIPMVVENVKGAQPWVGKAPAHYGSFYLWGDVPALPKAEKAVKVVTKNTGGSWFNVAHNTTSGKGRNPDGRRTAPGKGARFTSRDCGLEAQGVKQRGSGREWFAGDGKISRMSSSGSPARKFASAMIAKIPLPLSRHIARTFKPTIIDRIMRD